jgi:hypothetical protein
VGHDAGSLRFSGFLKSSSTHTHATYLLLPALIYATIDWEEVFTKDNAYTGDGCIVGHTNESPKSEDERRMDGGGA